MFLYDIQRSGRGYNILYTDVDGKNYCKHLSDVYKKLVTSNFSISNCLLAKLNSKGLSNNYLAQGILKFVSSRKVEII